MIEVLISSMDCNTEKLVKKMNIQTDCIVINQTNKNEYNETCISENLCRSYSFSEKGVGLSRNNALLRAKSKICMMADDDMIYVDGYENIVLQAYKENPQADMIIFKVDNHINGKIYNSVTKNEKVHFLNSLKYGTVSFTFRREEIVKRRIFFSTLFGGGAKYGSGEDSLFLWDCLKKGMNVVTYNKKIADVYNYDSSWFEGYNEKYFIDKGALFYSLSPLFSEMLIIQYILRHSYTYKSNKEFSRKKVHKLMRLGKKEVKERKNV